jgi:hypothetical protein
VAGGSSLKELPPCHFLNKLEGKLNEGQGMRGQEIKASFIDLLSLSLLRLRQ